MNTYFPISITPKGETLYAIWYSKDAEGLVCKDGRLLTFRDLPALFAYAKTHTPDISPDLHKSYDLDALAEFCADEDRYASADALDHWGLFADLAAGIGKSFAGDGNSFQLNDIYEKLCMAGIDFGGDPDETDTRFDLTPEEESLTKAVLKTGIELYAKYRGEPIS